MSNITTNADENFEPTIDMLVNDFDDEQTLNEEEALAACELHDPQDEIATLREESEMPIEQLLAKYSALPKLESFHKKSRKSSHIEKYVNGKDESVFNDTKIRDELKNSTTKIDEMSNKNSEVNVSLVELSEDYKSEKKETGEEGGINKNIDINNTNTPIDIELKNKNDNFTRPIKIIEPKRSHLLDLYPEHSFTTTTETQVDKEVGLGTFYDDEDEDDCDEDAEDDTESDYVKKTIMIGTAYQAVIPNGLSQYVRDILPYENEDKLVWEPSQVSEREVELYLLKAREIKPNLSNNNAIENISVNNPTPKNSISLPNDFYASNVEAEKFPEILSSQSENLFQTNIVNEVEQGSVIKDNEQALHLLVQCGYDFKEALRRKRLNAVPLTGSISLWSEEECQNFEEGIQKYGKDFLKIRQNQVRTRSMREIVQFYYLWKKSERRDQNFANSDTVDHMDIYLNESGDYGSNHTSAAVIPGSYPSVATTLLTRKNSTSNQKNVSIMIGNNTTTALNTQQSSILLKPTCNRKRSSAIVNLLSISPSELQNNSASFK